MDWNYITSVKKGKLSLIRRRADSVEVFDSVMASQRVLDWALPIEEAQKAEEEWDGLMSNYDGQNEVQGPSA